MIDAPHPNRIAELFGYSTMSDVNWTEVVSAQDCPFTGKRCYKVRKSDPTISIGTCTVRAGEARVPLVICPDRFLDGGQVFTDTLHLLTNHEPGNELHIVSEVGIPGGSVDYFVVSARDGRPVDFVGVEFQALDTTGTVWPHRQEFLVEQGILSNPEREMRSFGINWKMTAKTILVQLHHKIQTFEAVNRKLVLVLQDDLMRYMAREFSFGHLAEGFLSDSMHFHPYQLADEPTGITMHLGQRRSTDEAGIATALNLGQTGRVEVEELLSRLQAKMSAKTRWQPMKQTPVGAVEPMLDVSDE
jgi:hypothetical protein